jgi:hypothetical protein
MTRRPYGVPQTKPATNRGSSLVETVSQNMAHRRQIGQQKARLLRPGIWLRRLDSVRAATLPSSGHVVASACFAGGVHCAVPSYIRCPAAFR